MSAPARGERKARTASVVRTEWLTPALVRVRFTGDDLRELPPLSFTDHYIKILFPPAGSTAAEALGADRRPVTRTYTIRSYDRETNELAIDFVVHGTEGLAGPWAATAQPGDTIAFMGPGGAYAPDPTADVHLFVGDESAVPAIAAALEALPAGASAEAFVEVAGPGYEPAMPSAPGISVHWVYRGEQPYGEPLARAVRAADYPQGAVSVFVHGNAGMIKDLRRYFFVEHGVARASASISGYWRTNYTEDRWQSTKREFVAEMEAEEAATV
jgi:NADPH-dependent ferric siderophore reductase